MYQVFTKISAEPRCGILEITRCFFFRIFFRIFFRFARYWIPDRESIMDCSGVYNKLVSWSGGTRCLVWCCLCTLSKSSIQEETLIGSQTVFPALSIWRASLEVAFHFCPAVLCWWLIELIIIFSWTNISVCLSARRCFSWHLFIWPFFWIIYRDHSMIVFVCTLTAAGFERKRFGWTNDWVVFERVVCSDDVLVLWLSILYCLWSNFVYYNAVCLK